MLQSKHTKNDVITLKLFSGEEIIGYYVSDDANAIILRKPMAPVPTEGGMALAPYLMSSNYLHESIGELSFTKNAIITTILTSNDFKNAYIKQVSGLDFAASGKPKLIVP
jgi:hypothetical protein